jgi:hypothetical protein
MRVLTHWLLALSETEGGSGNRRNIVTTTIFRMIQIVLLPIALVGYVLFAVKAIMFSRGSGVSATAQRPNQRIQETCITRR